jgi:hypothetical protein
VCDCGESAFMRLYFTYLALRQRHALSILGSCTPGPTETMNFFHVLNTEGVIIEAGNTREGFRRARSGTVCRVQNYGFGHIQKSCEINSA